MSYRIRTEITGAAGAPWVNTTHWDDSLGMRVEDAVNNIWSFWDAIAGLMHSDLVIQVDPTVTLQNDDGGQPTGTTTVVTDPIGGTNTSHMLPTQTQALIHFGTGYYNQGREVTGKLYVPGLCESANTPNGLLETGDQGTIQDAIDAVWNGGSGLSTPGMLIYSRKIQAAFPVTGAVVRSKWAVLRSRRD